jgi:hypothetical protein
MRTPDADRRTGTFAFAFDALAGRGMVLLLTREGRLRPKDADETAAAAERGPEPEPGPEPESEWTPDLDPVDPVVAANRARIAALRRERYPNAPLDLLRWVEVVLPSIGLFCGCIWHPLAVPLTALGLAVARWSRRVARRFGDAVGRAWPASRRRTAPAWRIAGSLVTALGIVVALIGACWSVPIG